MGTKARLCSVDWSRMYPDSWFLVRARKQEGRRRPLWRGAGGGARRQRHRQRDDDDNDDDEEEGRPAKKKVGGLAERGRGADGLKEYGQIWRTVD